MNTLRVLLIVVVVMISFIPVPSTQAQPNEYMMDGTMWTLTPGKERITYVLGFTHGVSAAMKACTAMATMTATQTDHVVPCSETYFMFSAVTLK